MRSWPFVPDWGNLPVFERLEDRWMLGGTTLTIRGSDAADLIAVGQLDSNTLMIAIGRVSGTPTYRTYAIPQGTQKVQVLGLKGDDDILIGQNVVLRPGISLWIDGGPGNDRINAQPSAIAVAILGGSGDDAIVGGEGNDLIDGGSGEDDLIGWKGDDTVQGGGGDDGIEGGPGNDRLMGGAGCDGVHGGAGNDQLYGGSSQKLPDDSSDNALFGEDGNDTLVAGDFGDRLYGGRGNDLLIGGRGNDTLSGEAGADTLKGDRGNDQLTGGAGKDELFGGAGNDVFDSQDGVLDEIVNGGPGKDSASVDVREILFQGAYRRVPKDKPADIEMGNWDV